MSRLQKLPVMIPFGTRPAHGFTMVELVTTLVILGILVAMVAPRFFDRNTFENRGFYDRVISTLRYAQKAAIAQRRFVCVAVAANGVTLTYDPIPFNAITHPAAACPGSNLTGPTGQTPYSVFSNNALFSNGAPAAFNFDAMGKPSSTQSFTVSGYTANPITVEVETGYVH